MNRENSDRRFEGIPLLLFLLLALPLAAGIIPGAGPKPQRCENPVFLELKGDVAWPGVLASCKPLDLFDGSAMKRVLGALPARDTVMDGISLKSGNGVDVKIEAGKAFLSPGEMSPFYKATLGIPIPINAANPEALTAVPGIGLKLAHRIVRERDRRGGFKRVEELMTVSGIGPNLYKRIKPHLAL
jgi:competence protein ComEA